MALVWGYFKRPNDRTISKFIFQLQSGKYIYTFAYLKELGKGVLWANPTWLNGIRRSHKE